MEVTVEAISFLESIVFPKLAEKWRQETSTLPEQQVVPHRLPLKRRLAEFRYGSITSRRTSLQTVTTTATTTTTLPASGTKEVLTSAMSLTSSGPSLSTNVPSTIPTNFTNNLWAIERFRDITPAFVMAIFEDNVVLEPGDVGPLPLNHPVAQHLIECVNEQRISYGLLKTLREFEAPFYDGGIVVGIVDYRRWAFGVAKGNVTSGSGTAAEQPISTSITPEMHKIFLKLPWEILIQDITELTQSKELPEWFITVTGDGITNMAIGESTAPLSRPASPSSLSRSPLRNSVMASPARQTVSGNGLIAQALRSDESKLEFEAKLVMATAPPLCLDPSPLVSQVMTALNYDVYKMRATLRPIKLGPIVTSSELGEDETAWRTARINSWMQENNLLPGKNRGTRPRFNLLTLLERQQAERANRKEPLYGLDARKDPSRLKLSGPPSLSWLAPGESLWRTMRFEHCLRERETLHYTAHVLVIQLPRGSHMMSGGAGGGATSGGLTVRFEIILRIGSQPCWGDLWERTAIYQNRATIEAFIEQFKQLMQMEGKQCVADVSNPGAIHALMRPTPDPMAGTGAASNFLTVSMAGISPLGTPFTTTPGGMMMGGVSGIRPPNIPGGTPSTSNLSVPTARPMGIMTSSIGGTPIPGHRHHYPHPHQHQQHHHPSSGAGIIPPHSGTPAIGGDNSASITASRSGQSAPAPSSTPITRMPPPMMRPLSTPSHIPVGTIDNSSTTLLSSSSLSNPPPPTPSSHGKPRAPRLTNHPPPPSTS